MKKLNCILLLSLVLLLLVGCSKDNTQSETLKSDDVVSLEKAKPNKYVPFKGSFEVYVDPSSVLEVAKGHILPEPPFILDPPNPPFMKYQIVNGEGKASHLGLTNLWVEQWWGPDPYTDWTGRGVGNFQFTAANGDILLADYNNAKSLHVSPTYVEVYLTGEFKDGGTGRFTHADGSFEWEVIFNPVENFGTVTATGEIMYSK